MLYVRSLSRQSDVKLLSYIASDELVQVINVLRRNGITLSLVETPGRNGRDIAEKFDEKSGFRELSYEWNPDHLGPTMPPGVICRTAAEALMKQFKDWE